VKLLRNHCMLNLPIYEKLGYEGREYFVLNPLFLPTKRQSHRLIHKPSSTGKFKLTTLRPNNSGLNGILA
jgi:hypothetical protein